MTAGATRLHTFAAGLASRSHEVEVVCEVPSHPEGAVAEGYGGHLVDRRRMDGIDVNYVWVRPTASEARGSRLFNYASFAATAALAGVSRRRPDVVLASSPPLSVGAVGATLALRHRVPWVLDVRDLWPDAAVALGQIGQGRMLRMVERLEARLYRSASAITATTEPFVRAIEARGGKGKASVIPNGTTNEFLAIGSSSPQRSVLGADGDFTWTHAGNIGEWHGLETAVAAAGQLGEGFRLLFLGSGLKRATMEAMAANLPSGTVAFMDPVQPREAAQVMRASDALLVSFASLPGLEGSVPSKLYDYCAVARPLVVAAAGETRRMAEKTGGALCVAPGDPSGLAAAVRRLREDRSLREHLASRARAFAEVNSRERGVDSLERILRSVVGG